jgi:hypothetical protein
MKDVYQAPSKQHFLLYASELNFLEYLPQVAAIHRVRDGFGKCIYLFTRPSMRVKMYAKD